MCKFSFLNHGVPPGFFLFLWGLRNVAALVAVAGTGRKFTFVFAKHMGLQQMKFKRSRDGKVSTIAAAQNLSHTVYNKFGRKSRQN